MGKVWTKDAEREQLRKIAELIEETECGSYIRMAFAGCVKMAEENIEFDFANSYPDQIDFKDKQNAEMGEKLLKLEHENQAMEQHLKEKEAEIQKLGHMLESKSAECNRIAEERDAMADCVDGSNEIIDKADAEIRKLKAEIVRMKFDRMTEEQVSELYEKMEGVN